MQHSEESKGDLCFLIPKDAKEPKDIPITLVYCNRRVTTEDATDHLEDWAEDCGIPWDCIAFYHAKALQSPTADRLLVTCTKGILHD